MASPALAPQKSELHSPIFMTGLYAVIGIQAALADRAQSGLGQHVDLALLDVTVATLANQATNYLVGGLNPTRLGNAHPNIVPLPELCGQRWLSDSWRLATTASFRRYCQVIGPRLSWPMMSAFRLIATGLGIAMHWCPCCRSKCWSGIKRSGLLYWKPPRCRRVLLIR